MNGYHFCLVILTIQLLYYLSFGLWSRHQPLDILYELCCTKLCWHMISCALYGLQGFTECRVVSCCSLLAMPIEPANLTIANDVIVVAWATLTIGLQRPI